MKTIKTATQAWITQLGMSCVNHGEVRTRRVSLVRKGLGFVRGRSDGGLARENRLIKGEEDGAEGGCRLFVRIGLELRMDVGDKR